MSALVLHESKWLEALDRLVTFRRRMRLSFGIKLREEIHASQLLGAPGELVRIKRNDRLTILRSMMLELAAMDFARVVTVAVDKQGKDATYDPFAWAWTALLTRIQNTILGNNFPIGGPRAGFLLVPDNGDAKKLTQLHRKLRRYNMVPSRYGGSLAHPLTHEIEDPLFRDSRQSFFIQAADSCAFWAKQHLDPNSFVKNKVGGGGYWNRLSPIWCKEAAPRFPDAITRL